MGQKKKQQWQDDHSCSRKNLLQLVDKNVLKKILDAFTKATGLTANIVDTEGKSIFSKEDAQKSCKFCLLIWKMQRQRGLQRCRGAYARAGRQAAIFGEPYIFRCPSGLIEWAAPIIIDGQHLGSIICGQVLMWEPEEFFWIELKQMNKILTDDFDLLFDAAKELKVISGKKVQGAADLLFVTANYIMKAGWENLRHRQEIALQQSLLNEEIQNRKCLEEKLNAQSLSLNYSLEKEKELISKVKLGDLDKAKKIFRVLLADIFIAGAAKLPTIKARVLELGVILSRASVEGGADLNQALEISAEFLQDVNRFNLIEEIDLAAVKALERYLQAVQSNQMTKNHLVIQGIKRFIRNNHDKSLTLEEIAASVYLSPYYVSRIFKENQNMTVMDYVTKVKLEEAKKLLRNPRYQIDEIAERLGYSDASYFSKVFRRNEGMSPTQFRRQA
ncbi:PocR ligand-binding domain-containing protein [Clostridium formicaceticum]|uniref:AraC family transcriptional regulator n=1 Tax=Clostridium formicaceticum TaxID=1497 RepID=A0AAC9RST4_9CLOT|nr:PocR ligand-binding domain-containing protein [Clostridium formicaceticum]AOY74952.1 AraC family transcriptional regulator [Clostridium formicaceticum]ARE89360.1 HTH-type transcriptional activator Btr [Clostridium formicaceticum]